MMRRALFVIWALWVIFLLVLMVGWAGFDLLVPGAILVLMPGLAYLIVRVWVAPGSPLSVRASRNEFIGRLAPSWAF